MITDINLIYIISDKSRNSALGSQNKINLLLKLISIIKFNQIFIVADNCTDDTVAILKLLNVNLLETSLGNTGSFKFCIKLALDLPENQPFYLCEDDYFHSEQLRNMDNAELVNLLEVFDYLSFYSHPDKLYSENYNLSDHIRYKLSERTYLFKSLNDNYYKTTSSTTLTFITKPSTLKGDLFFWKYFVGSNKSLPRDAFPWEIITSSYRSNFSNFKSIFKNIIIYLLNIGRRKKFLGVPIISNSEHLDLNIISQKDLSNFLKHDI